MKSGIQSPASTATDTKIQFFDLLMNVEQKQLNRASLSTRDHSMDFGVCNKL